MTREEAIRYGNEWLKDEYLDAKDAAFIKMAIKAFVQEPCEDAISREDAIRIASGFCHPANVAKELAKLPSVQPEPKTVGWIPVSERPPEEFGTYTITAYDGATERVTYAKYLKRLKQWELTGARAYWRVLAWMPLPEPYKEVSK